MKVRPPSIAIERASVHVQSLDLSDDGRSMGSPYPALLYRDVFPSSRTDTSDRGSSPEELARRFESLFEANDWPPAWRAGLYTVPHYHAAAHEVLGVFRGWAKAWLGGEAGVLVTLRAGDVLLLPAGVAHENRGDSGDFCAVGAYPRGMRVDMRYERDRQADAARLERVPPPATDPVFGGPCAAG
jgi:uncharacterized protein YjlB